MTDPQIIDTALIRSLEENARSNARKRVHYELHCSHADPVQRFLNVMTPESYIPPHVHPAAGAWELFTILRGNGRLILFDFRGYVERIIPISPTATPVCEIPPAQVHAVIADEPSAFLEIKPGPFNPRNPKTICAWAPAEDSLHAESFLEWMRQCRRGERWNK
jgi:cupin fold WbuC family metalloprotein